MSERNGVDVNRLVLRDGAERIDRYQKYKKERCVSDAVMRRLIRKRLPDDTKIQRAKYRVGTVVEATMWPGRYLVVGHGFTGKYGEERGCIGCKITDRVFKKWQWIGPDRTIRKIPSQNTEVGGCQPTDNDKH